MSIIFDLIILYPTYFFLNVLNSKNIYLCLFYGLILDFLIASSYGFITIFLFIFFLIKKYFKNYYIYNIMAFISFYFLFNILFKLNLNTFYLSFFLQLIFIYLNRKHILKW